nr:hypothetical protein [Tanacetum cinerariifolium]
MAGAVSVVIAIFMVDPRPIRGVRGIIQLLNATEAFPILRTIFIRNVQPVRAASTTRMILGACPAWSGLGCAWFCDSGHNRSCISYYAHSSESDP